MILNQLMDLEAYLTNDQILTETIIYNHHLQVNVQISSHTEVVPLVCENHDFSHHMHV
jgi:hypothetical protein